MKRCKILNIQSVSDIITNSSSEVFVINAENSAVKEFINTIGERDKSYYLDIFETEDDVKKFLVNNIFHYDVLSDIDGFIEKNVLKTIADYHYPLSNLEEKGVSIEKMVEIFLPLYSCLVGKVVLNFEDDCGYPSWIDDIISFSRKNNLIEFSDRV
jgi:hypothetical protein